MAAQLLDLEKKSTSEIFDTAKKLGFTNKGEMFSAEWLRQLAVSLWPMHSSVTLVTGRFLINQSDRFWCCCACCLRLCEKLRTSSATWARSSLGFTGSSILVVTKTERSLLLAVALTFIRLRVGYLYVDMDAKDIRPAADVVVKDEDAFYVFAYHGKSKHMGLWSYSSLRQSSFNLTDAGPERKEPDYVLPPDGLSQLCGKCVILEKEIAKL
ncbi:hypothetical protein OSTOST_08820 [Ostertagia ostertagi]